MIVSLLATYLVRRWALRRDFVDRPGGHKQHGRPVALGGGIALVIAICGPLLAATVAVCEAEGLEPVRVVYLLRMYDYSLEESLDDWWEAGGSEEFFDWLLEPAVDRDSADEAALDRIIEAGLAHVEEQQEMRLTRTAQRVALRRARAEGDS